MSNLFYHRDKQASTLPFTPVDNLKWLVNQTPSLHVFGQWEEARVPGENPRRRMENVQTPHRSAWTGESNLCAVRRHILINERLLEITGNMLI